MERNKRLTTTYPRKLKLILVKQKGCFVVMLNLICEKLTNQEFASSSRLSCKTTQCLIYKYPIETLIKNYISNQVAVRFTVEMVISVPL